jgi:RHS repeat-associated protein
VRSNGTIARTFTHDAAGNMTADDRAGTVYAYRHNNRGRLDRVSVGAQVRADYVYDALERMALRTTQNMTPSGTTHYLYDRAGHLLAEASDSGTTIREYVWLDDMPLAVVADVDTATPQLWYVHVDHLDRPIKMTDDTKAVVWDAVFRPFGEVESITGAASNNLRFPGQYFLIEAGLHYNWHRHYDPRLGRYLQPEPLTFVDGPNLYAYALSSPAQFFDNNGLTVARTSPTGRLWWDTRLNRGGGGGPANTCPYNIPKDPKQKPHPDFEWRGPDDKGAWYNPKTGESLWPDMNHANPIGPHWDYIDPSGRGWRALPDRGIMRPK